MLGRTRFVRCAAPTSLTRWLGQIAERAECLDPSRTNASTELTTLWADIEKAAVQASALRETDTLTAVVQRLLMRDLWPTQPQTWLLLAERLLSFNDIECCSVLQYPGTPDAVLRSAAVRTGPYGSRSPALSTVSREILLLAGGVVPLSARTCTADGAALSSFLKSFSRACRGMENGDTALPSRPELRRMCAAVLKTLRLNAATVRFDALCDGLSSFLTLLLRNDLAQLSVQHPSRPLSTASPSRVPDEVPSGADSADAPLCSSFLQELQRSLHCTSASSGLGPRLALKWLGTLFTEAAQKAVFPGSTDEASPAAEQRRALLTQLHLSMIETASTQLYDQLAEVTALPKSWQLSTLLTGIHGELEVVLQRSVNRGDVLFISPERQAALVSTVVLAHLRVLRLEHRTPDAFLRDAVSIVEKLPASMLVEAELLFAKVALLDLLDLEEEGRDAVYDDLVKSLRAVVELRPRAAPESAGPSGGLDEPFGDSNSLASGAGEYDFERRASASPTNEATRDSTAHAVLQRAHVAVLTALCGAHQQERIDQAYELVVAHKYHGLVVNSEVILPLLKVMSRRGDGRVFNLVDLCVLYCQCPVDMASITYLFQACAVAGDHYRARSLYQLLQEVIPGFALKTTASIKESLRELQILPAPPTHAFMTESQRLARMAVQGADVDTSDPAALPAPADVDG